MYDDENDENLTIESAGGRDYDMQEGQTPDNIKGMMSQRFQKMLQIELKDMVEERRVKIEAAQEDLHDALYQQKESQMNSAREGNQFKQKFGNKLNKVMDRKMKSTIDKDENSDGNPDDDDVVDMFEMQGFQTGGANYEKNKQIFIEAYGTWIKFPGQYIIDSKVNPNDKTQIVQIVKYVIPDEQDHQLKFHRFLEKQEDHGRSHFEGRESIDNNWALEKTFKEAYDEEIYQNKVVLKLYTHSEEEFRVEREVVIRNAREAIISFSPDGHYFAIFMPKINNLEIYEVNCMNDFLDEYEQEQGLEPKVSLNHPELKGMKNLLWNRGSASDYLCLFNKKKLRIVDIENSDICGDKFDIKEGGKLSRILQAVVFVRNEELSCLVACLDRDRQQVRVQNIATDNNSSMCKVQVSPEATPENIKIGFSNDISMMVYTDPLLNIGLQLAREDNDSFETKAYSHLGSQRIRSILPVGDNEFMFVCCQKYDTCLCIRSSEHENFELHTTDRNVESSFLTIYDVIQFDTEDHENQFGEQLMLLSSMDEQFYSDKLLPINALRNSIPGQYEDNSVIEDSRERNDIEGIAFTWPYVVFRNFRKLDKGNPEQTITTLTLIELNEKSNTKDVHQIVLPTEVQAVMKCVITEQYELIILANMNGGSYTLYAVDLNKFAPDDHQKTTNLLEFETILNFRKDDVQYKLPIEMVARSSSEKDELAVIDNIEFMCFIMFEDRIIQIKRGMQKIKRICQDYIIRIPKIESKNDGSFYFMCESQSKKLGNIISTILLMKLEMGFSDFKISRMFQQKQDTVKIETFAFDVLRNILILIKRPMSKKKAGQKTISIIDIQEDNILYAEKIRNIDLSGRFMAQNLQICNGHLYFNNQCIKIRYDLLYSKTTSREFEENEIFDYFDGVLPTEQNEQVMSGLPLISFAFHRMLYIIKNQNDKSAKKILVLPLLSERKILLNRTKDHCNYFYTAIANNRKSMTSGHSIMQMNLTNMKYHIFTPRGFLTYRKDFSWEVSEYGDPITVSNDGSVFVFMKKGELVVLNIMLLNLKGFKHIKSINLYEDIKNIVESSNEEENPDKITIEDINEYGFDNPSELKLDSVNVNDLFDVLIRLVTVKKKKKLQNIIKGRGGLFKKAIQSQLPKKAKQKKMQNPLIFFQAGVFNTDEGLFKSSLRESTVNQIEKRDIRNNFLIKTQQHEQFQKGLSGQSMTTTHIYFYNNFQIWSLDLRKQYDLFQEMKVDFEFKGLSLYVDKKNNQSQIKKVRTGSMDEKIMILIQQTKDSVFTLLWDVVNDIEMESFDHGLNPKTLWDSDGDCYITEDEKVFICKQGVVLNCFDVSKTNKKLDKQQNPVQGFGIHRGHRFDPVNHSWLIMQDFITMSFSYMTFVINHQFQKLDTYQSKDFLFDLEQYDFILNRNTFFHDATLMMDAKRLEFILSNSKKSNPVILQQLQYQTPLSETEGGGFDTPLHIALRTQNTRALNLIMSYMAQIDCNMSTFKTIWPQLVNLSQFNTLFQKITIQKIQMQQKQTLKVESIVNDAIVQISQSRCSFVDEAFFQNNGKSPFKKFKDRSNSRKIAESYWRIFKEWIRAITDKFIGWITSFSSIAAEFFKNEPTTYPVKIVALEIGWIIRDKEGKKFLEEIYKGENNELFEVQSTQILVEYLFGKVKKFTLYFRFPLWFFTLVVFLFTINFREQEISDKITQKASDVTIISILANITEIALNTTSQVLSDSDPYEINIDDLDFSDIQFVGFINLIGTFLTLVPMIVQTKSSKTTYWSSVWAFFDLTYVVLNSIASYLIITSDSTSNSLQSYRTIMAALSLVIWVKGIYFLQLFDSLSPLIDSIFMILRSITYFMITFVLLLFTFANAYYLIGRNQVAFDNLPKDKDPEYTTISGSINFMIKMAYGEVDEAGNFGEGKGTMKFALWIIFIFSSFTIIVLMLNMLIAIMGDSFNQRQLIAKQTVYRTKLKFVLDNWFLKDYALGKDFKETQYLVVALFNEEETDNQELQKTIQEDLAKINLSRREFSIVIMQELKKMRTRLSVIEKYHNE